MQDAHDVVEQLILVDLEELVARIAVEDRHQVCLRGLPEGSRSFHDCGKLSCAARECPLDPRWYADEVYRPMKRRSPITLPASSKRFTPM